MKITKSNKPKNLSSLFFPYKLINFVFNKFQINEHRQKTSSQTITYHVYITKIWYIINIRYIKNRSWSIKFCLLYCFIIDLPTTNSCLFTKLSKFFSFNTKTPSSKLGSLPKIYDILCKSMIFYYDINIGYLKYLLQADL